VPFVSKTLNVNFIELATRVMLGQDVKSRPVHLLDFNFIACKVAMFSFLRLSGSDPHVGVEMQSTGEVACFGRDVHEAFLKGMLAAGLKLPRGLCGVLLSLGAKADKQAFLPYVELLAELGYKLYATAGTASFIEANTPPGSQPLAISILQNAVSKKKPNVCSAIQEGEIKLVITTPSTRNSGGATAGYFLRRKALDSGVALVVDLRQAMMLVDALYNKRSVESSSGEGEFWTYDSWQECHRIG